MNDAFHGLSTIVMLLLPVIGALALVLRIAFLIKEDLDYKRSRMSFLRLADYERPTVSLDPKPEARPGIFLRHFNSPQRAYLRQQRWWIAGYIFCSWLSLVIFILGLGGGREELNSHWNLGWCALLAFIFAGASVEREVLEGRFIRTRPLTRCFAFWSSTGVVLTSLLTAIATTVLGLFLMLRMSYGPVWSQGPSAIDPPDIAKQAYLISTLRTSPLPPFLPLLTTTTLVFGLVVAVGSLYLRLITHSTSKSALFVRRFFWPSFLFVFLYVFINGPYSNGFKRILFEYNNAGPPASYAYALVLLAIAAALLKLAEFVNERRETS
jgi:hypothetical protein